MYIVWRALGHMQLQFRFVKSKVSWNTLCLLNSIIKYLMYLMILQRHLLTPRIALNMVFIYILWDKQFEKMISSYNILESIKTRKHLKDWLYRRTSSSNYETCLICSTHFMKLIKTNYFFNLTMNKYICF